MPTKHTSDTPIPASSLRFTWQVNVPILILGGVFLALLTGLGFWQLDRAEQKQKLLAQLETRLAQPPLDITELTDQALMQLPPYTQVSVHARADNQRVLLLDNKIHGGRFGYQVVQLVQTPLANVLINRGWVPGSHDRSERPRIETLAPEQRYMGRIGVLSQHPMLNTTPLDDDYPKRFNQLSLTAVGQQLGVSVSQIIELAPESYGALTVNWPKVNVSPAKHLGYAVQWFCMSLALLVLLFFANSNLSALLKARANNNQHKM